MKKAIRKKAVRKKNKKLPVPPTNDWRTTDQDEIHRRTQRAIDEKHSVRNLDPEQPVFSTFAVGSPSGMSYQVEIRDITNRAFSCTCPDFRSNGLGTCKHVEATLIRLKRRLRGQFTAAKNAGSPFIDIVPGNDRLVVERNFASLTPTMRSLFDADGTLLTDPAQ